MIYSVLASLNRLRPCGGPACEVMQCRTWYSPGCVRLESDSGWAGVPHWPLARQLGVNTRCCPANSITRRVLTPLTMLLSVVCCVTQCLKRLAEGWLQSWSCKRWKHPRQWELSSHQRTEMRKLRRWRRGGEEAAARLGKSIWFEIAHS